MKVFAFSAFVAAILGFVAAAHAEDGQGKGRWDYRAAVIYLTDVPLLDHRALRVVEEDSPAFAAQQERMSVGMLAGDVRLLTDWLELTAFPYALISEHAHQVGVAALDVTAMVPVTGWLRLGLVHASAHNIADGRFAYGTNLNGLAFDVRYLDGRHRFLREFGEHRAWFGAVWYPPGPHRNAPANIVTAEAEIPEFGAGHTVWQAQGGAEFWHPRGHALCQLRGRGAAADALSSVVASCGVEARLNFLPLGALGEHLFLGPEISYGRNLTRTDTFGRDEWGTGIRLELELADTEHSH